MQWNENVGKLTFVNSILPAEIREVWQETPGISLFSPVQGEIVHAWSQEEPYLLLNSVDGDIRAAAGGEVMAVAHGVNEEKILRVRHWDGTESVYGNLKQSYVDVGAEIHAGEILGEVLDLQPLAFEMRMNGKSVDVTNSLKPFAE
ncbi:MAG: M23 family metallopeptidase [Clostridia bacterium]|nr:M23 family metallopeptidase [Clostridia bacterium]